ncbi:MAG: carboxymuconolactone decarboxylase family protein [Pseudomonadota bacterium]
MERLNFIDPEEAKPFIKKLFEKIGMVPNLYGMMANSAMSFDGFIKLTACLYATRLEKKYREMIYLATSRLNGCEYCRASHTATAVEHGLLTAEECIAARKRQSPDPKVDALLKFTGEAVEKRGKVSDECLQKVRDRGFEDHHIVAAVATIALATFSNYLSNVAQPDMDYLDAPPID